MYANFLILMISSNLCKNSPQKKQLLVTQLFLAIGESIAKTESHLADSSQYY